MYAGTVYKEIFAFILFSTRLPSMSANWANFNVSNNLFYKHNYIEQNRSQVRKSRKYHRAKITEFTEYRQIKK